MSELDKPALPNIDEIYEIAKQVREGFEQETLDHDLIWDRYCRWVPQARNWSRGVFLLSAAISFPRGCCGLTSAFLNEEMDLGDEQHVRNLKYKDEKHTVLLGSVAMVDITADQFGGPRIYVGPMVKPWSETS